LLSWASEAQQVATWAIGFLDEVWWSRFALPQAHVWQDQQEPVRFVEQSWQKADADAKALACCCSELASQGKTGWLLIWDNASWH
jgi:hypothetical protein